VLEYCSEPGADPAAVGAILRGSVLGALLHQRGELPLHATTVVTRDASQAVALAGSSGAGKSTIAFELISRGWTLLSDDLTRVSLLEGRPVVQPGRSELRLRSDACSLFGVDTSVLAPAPGWPDKYVLAPPVFDRPMALSVVVDLEPSPGPLQVEMVGGGAALRALVELTYRLHYVEALGRARQHLELVAATSRAARVLRARGRDGVGQTADTILRALGAGA
jgi:hypothetical protein